MSQSPEYELRCPKCGRDEILVRGVCWIQLAAIHEDGTISVWQDSGRDEQPDDADDQLKCGNCDAHFWETDLKLKPVSLSGVAQEEQP